MDDIAEYMGETAVTLSDFEVRLSAVEKMLTSLPGMVMETDPSRLPVVVYETTPSITEPVVVTPPAENTLADAEASEGGV